MNLLCRRARLVVAASGPAACRSPILPAMASIVLLTGCATFQPDNTTSINSIRQPYVGIGIGASLLDADTPGEDLKQNNSSGTAFQLTLGLSLNELISVETRAADLGEATFSTGEAVGYQVADVSALYKQNFGKVSGFARIGAGALFSDGDIRTGQNDKVHLLVGLGADYAINSSVGLRAEWQGHDTDIMHSQLSFVYRFGAKPARSAVVIARNNNTDNGERLSDADFQAVPDKSNESEQLANTAQTPVESAQPEPAAEPASTSEAKPEPVAEPEQKPAPEETVTANDSVASAQTSTDADAQNNALPTTSDEQLALVDPQTSSGPEADQSKTIASEPSEKSTATTDADKDGTDDALNKCLGTDAESPGCPVFEDLVAGLTFVPETDRLTDSGIQVLETVADGLANESDLHITVAVHTAPTTDANAAMFLTRQRTIAIIRYLTSKGIDATRLRPEAYGDTQPLADAKIPSDNDRVVFSTR